MVNTRSLALTAVSVGSVALQAAAQICYRYSFETSVEYVGQDITNVKSPNPYDCCGFCADQLACNAFSWTDFEGGTCWLKSTKGETKPSNGTTSAYDPKVDASSTCPNLHNDVYYTGEELVRLRSVKSAGDCCVECGKRPECLTFTWNPDSVYGGYCTLQKTAGELKPYAGYVSGGRQAADPTCPPIQSGLAYSTNYLTSVQGVQSSGDCCAKCKENSQCAVFTWYFNSPYLQCSLYTAGAKLVASDAAFSGVPAGSQTL